MKEIGPRGGGRHPHPNVTVIKFSWCFHILCFTLFATNKKIQYQKLHFSEARTGVGGGIKLGATEYVFILQ